MPANPRIREGSSPNRDDNPKLVRENIRAIKHILGNNITPSLADRIEALTQQTRFSVSAGELQIISGNLYVTHTALLRLARRKRCRGIHVEAVESLCDSASGRYVLKATVYPSKTSSGFVGYGDADPANVSALVRGAEMRIAETRAVNRALRKAYGIGICSVEEIGANSSPTTASSFSHSGAKANGKNPGLKVRDWLCQIIRQYKLNPELVKAYAVDFCGTTTLKNADRTLVESFVQHLADSAQKDRNALRCQLNSYLRPTQEVGS